MSLSRILVFLLVVLGFTGLMHYYVWARLVRDPGWSANVTRGLGAGLAIMLVVQMASFFSQRGSRAIAEPLGLIGFTWLGASFLLVMFFVVSDILKLGLRLGAELPADPSRRMAFAKIVAGLTGVATGGLTLSGVVSVKRGPFVKMVPILLPKLAKEASGYVIAQLTDIHVGPTIGRDYIARIVKETNALSPDVIVITGDLVDGSVERLREHVAPLADLRAKEGVFFVTGNHEYYSGADEWISHLRSLGIRVLRNESVALRWFDLAGVDDSSAKRFGDGHGEDIPKAVSASLKSRPLVLLAHQPKAAPEAERCGVDLQLSGHTHGGQIIPWNFAVALDQPYVAGLHRRGNLQVYVSCGTGYWGPPMRVGAPSEIAKLVLEGSD